MSVRTSQSVSVRRSAVVREMESVSLAILVLVVRVVSLAPPDHSSQCELISVPQCQELPYNYTRMPNIILGYTDQVSAGLGLHHLQSMLDLDCSPYLAFFLCSLVTPMCTDQVRNNKTTISAFIERKKKHRTGDYCSL